MGIDKALQEQGYEFDQEYSDREAPAEMWINKENGMGLRLEWFRLNRR